MSDAVILFVEIRGEIFTAVGRLTRINADKKEIFYGTDATEYDMIQLNLL